MEIWIIVFLILLNGLFAMAEISVVSSRKSKLKKQAIDGNSQAQAALDLAEHPNEFLSTVQIGITVVSIFEGAFGGASIAKMLSVHVDKIPLLAPYSDTLSLIVVVSIITLLTLIFGELLPKRLGLNNPERTAGVLAQPMNIISKICRPLVLLLTWSTNWIIKLLPSKKSNEPSVSDEEVQLLLREGTQSGVFEATEKDIVERTFRLSDRSAQSLMTPRAEIVWIDIDSSIKTIRNKLIKKQHSYFPVCHDSLDKVIGILRTEAVLTDFLSEEKIDIKKHIHRPLFVPESMDGLKVLELFKKTGIHAALIVDEYGSVHGMITINDLLEAIVGDIPTINEIDEKEIMKKDDGNYIVDGLVPIDEFKEYFKVRRLPDERIGAFHTIGGFLMHNLERIPDVGDTFETSGYKFEVMQMDGHRIDKLLVYPSEI
jgi:putative hemolysin